MEQKGKSSLDFDFQYEYKLSLKKHTFLDIHLASDEPEVHTHKYGSIFACYFIKSHEIFS